MSESTDKELATVMARINEMLENQLLVQSIHRVNAPRRLAVETKLTANTAETLELLKAALNNLVPENTLEVELSIRTVVRGEDNES